MSKPLHLMLVTPNIARGGGGVAEVVRLLAHSLAKVKGIRVAVVTLSSQHMEEDRSAWPDIPIHHFRVYGPRKYGFSPGMLWYLLRHRADLVHVHGIWMFPVLAALFWKMRWHTPVIVTPHGMLEYWIMRRSRRLKWVISTLYQRRFLRNAEAIQVLTPKESEDVRTTIGHARCIEIPNFLPELPPAPASPDWYRPELEARRIFLFLGRIHEKKGWRALCEAWDAQCRIDPAFKVGAQLVFCGWRDGSEDFPSVIEGLAKEHGNVVYAGPQYGTQKLASFAVSSFFLLPSESEGLPMVVLEAWAENLPVIMTRACNLDIGFDRGAAIMVGTKADEIREGLAAAFAMPEEARVEMGRASYDLVAECFSEKVVIGDLLALYRRVST